MLDNAREEDPNEPPVALASLKDFGKFLKMRSDWIYPAIGISPRRNISIEWYKDDNHHLAIEFYGRGEVKFVIFAQDNVRPNKTTRIAGTASLEGIFEAIKSFNPLSWVTNSKGDIVPDTHTISRYCGFGNLTEEGRPMMAAFQLGETDYKPGESPHVSANWLEYLQGTGKAGQIDNVRRILAQKFKKVGATAKLALLRVNDIHRKMKEVEHTVHVLHWPMAGVGPRGNAYNDESHAGIFGVESDPDVIALALSQVACETVPARAA